MALSIALALAGLLGGLVLGFLVGRAVGREALTAYRLGQADRVESTCWVRGQVEGSGRSPLDPPPQK